MVSSSYAWIDENAEHTDADCTRAAALAKKWSELQSIEENRQFRRMADLESGYDYDPYDEDCECDACLADDCDNCHARKEDNERLDAARAERDLDIELIEDKLAAIGARMMRPYEHWSEDERYMEYQENRY